VRGAALFASKGCASCHTGGRAAGGPDLLTTPLPATLGRLAERMWNHGPRMREAMKRRGMKPVELTPQEMADVITYLLARRFLDEAGDAERGRRLFIAKGCDSCHGNTGGKTPLPRPLTSLDVAQAVWTKGRIMSERMTERGLPWPEFSERDLTDIMAFVNGGRAEKPR